MPIYEYACETCGNVIEVFEKLTHTIEYVFEPCKPCGDVWSRRRHKRIMSQSSFHLKGQRWAKDGYSNDYQDGSKVVSVTPPK